MATFIKVTQEGNELLRRNKEQTQGQRLNKLEGDEQQRIEQQARELRRQALLQQGRDASGNVLGGGRRQRFRPDEPAASYRPSKVLLISWDGITPIASDPAAIITIPGGTSSPYLSPTSLQNVPAVGVNSAPIEFLAQTGGEWQISSLVVPQAAQDFTFEAWGLHGVSGSFVDISLNWLNGELEGYVGISALAFPSGGFNIGKFLLFNNSAILTYETVEDTGIGQPFHICIQRQAGLFSFYFNGALYPALDRPDQASTVIGDNVYLNLTLDVSVGLNGMNKLGQVRLTTGQARYPQTGFTPNPLPFAR